MTFIPIDSGNVIAKIALVFNPAPYLRITRQERVQVQVITVCRPFLATAKAPGSFPAGESIIAVGGKFYIVSPKL